MIAQFQPEVTEASGAIRVAWDTRRAPHSRWPILHLTVAAIVLIIVCAISVWLCFLDLDWAWSVPCTFLVCLVCGLLLILNGSCLLARRYWAESIEVSQAAITVGRRGFLPSRPKVIPVRTGVELFFGYHDDDPDRRAAALDLLKPLSLQVVSSHPYWGWQTRTEVGVWLSVPAKTKVFEMLAAFIAANNIPVAVTYSPR